MWLVFLRKIHKFRNKLNWILKIWGVSPVKNDTFQSHKYSDKWTKIGVDIEMCLGNTQGNFQLHRFTGRENTTKSFRGLLFWLALYTGIHINHTKNNIGIRLKGYLNPEKYTRSTNMTAKRSVWQEHICLYIGAYVDRRSHNSQHVAY